MNRETEFYLGLLTGVVLSLAINVPMFFLRLALTHYFPLAGPVYMDLPILLVILGLIVVSIGFVAVFTPTNNSRKVWSFLQRNVFLVVLVGILLTSVGYLIPVVHYTGTGLFN